MRKVRLKTFVTQRAKVGDGAGKRNEDRSRVGRASEHCIPFKLCENIDTLLLRRINHIHRYFEKPPKHTAASNSAHFIKCIYKKVLMRRRVPQWPRAELLIKGFIAPGRKSCELLLILCCCQLKMKYVFNICIPLLFRTQG